MSISLLLEKMSVEEKIQAIECVWDDIGDRPGNFVLPSWYGEVLTNGESALQKDADESIDWETAKQNIHKEF